MSEMSERIEAASLGADSDVQRQIARRHAANKRMQWYGLGAIGFALGLLGILVVSLVAAGYTAFVQTHVTYPVHIDANKVDPEAPDRGNYRALVRDSFLAVLPGMESVGRDERRELTQMLSRGAEIQVRDRVVANPDLIGQRVAVTVPVSDRVDQLHKGVTPRDVVAQQRKMTDRQLTAYDALAAEDRLSTPFNWTLFTSADSRHPELAGLWGAIVGSAYALLVCFLLSFPIGVAAAIYLEEFASKNRLTDIIEVNINNLAAVPSVVFGLLGLAVYLNFFGLPRSAPLVGGMTLALMTLPTIIIATRSALKAVPPSVREAALGVGASRTQTVLHHVLPLSMSGILTGTIIGLAQALGETAPLLLIGMNAFITSAPGGIMESATALPTQIFMWADSPERGFVSRTSAAILVLLGFLVTMNLTAVLLRRRLERRW